MSAARVLCVNAGSSSLRVAVAERAPDGSLGIVARAAVERIGGSSLLVDDDGTTAVAAPDHAAALGSLLELATFRGAPAAVGHRLVHGGPTHAGPALLDADTLAEIDRWRALAPLHLPAALGLVATLAARLPGVAQVGCFDTAFGRALPPEARRLPIPPELDAAGLQRYGFHGLSYESVIERLGAGSLGRAVIAHLGAGSSLAAVVDGRPLHTTMGATPAGGTVMATRPGDLDPGILLYLVEQGEDAPALRRMIEHECGLAAVGGSPDMRELLARREHDPAAALAVELYCRSAAMHAAACTAALGGLDSLVFTGGIGEHSPAVRDAVCRRLAHLGVQLDEAHNQEGGGVISATGSPVVVHAVAADEEAVIARQAAAVGLGERRA